MVTEAGYGKRTQLERFNAQGRGGQGVSGIRLTGRKGQVVAAFMVGLDDDIVAVSSRRRHDPHAGPRDLLAGPRRHRRAGDEPRRRPDRRLGGADPGQRRRRGLTTRPPGGPSRAAAPTTGRRLVEVAPMRTARSVHRCPDDRGQATFLLLACIAFIAVVAAAAGALGARARRHASGRRRPPTPRPSPARPEGAPVRRASPGRTAAG